MLAVVVGRLTRPRSDSDGVSAGLVGYLLGAYDGTTTDPRVLATRDGISGWRKYEEDTTRHDTTCHTATRLLAGVYFVGSRPVPGLGRMQ